MTRSITYTIAGLLTLLAVNLQQNANAQIFATQNGGGVFVQGNGQGMAGTFDENGFQGIVVGPDGKTRKIRNAKNPFTNHPKTSFFAEGGAFAGAATASSPFAPGGFDPFDFVFGQNTRNPFLADESNTNELPELQRQIRNAEYTQARERAQRLLRQYPDDPQLLQLKALTDFALQDYEIAAANVYPVLQQQLAWDWQTLRQLYSDTQTYVQQLQNLQTLAQQQEAAPALHFLLAYHYLILDQVDRARDQLRLTLQMQPENRVARELLNELPPEILP